MTAIQITLDTNLVTSDAVRQIAQRRGFDVTIVTVTEREVENTPFQVQISPLHKVPETKVWGESRWDGNAVWGSAAAAETLRKILDLIAGGGWPKSPAERTEGHLRQLRDAMILEAHVRGGRDILVTDDKRAFIRAGRRAQLEGMFGTRIMTEDEFVTVYGPERAP